VDLGSSAAPSFDQLVENLAREESHRPFDLERDSLVRAVLARDDGRDAALLLTLHHIICDGWSLGVLVRDLEAAYNAIVAGAPAALAGPCIHYADYAVWEEAWLRTAEAGRQLEYWRRQLAGAPPLLQLPVDRPRPAEQTFEGANESMALPGSLTSALERFCRQAGVTPFMTGLAAFQVLLHRYTGEHDIVVGSPVANRRQPATEGVIGFFTNTLVLRSDLSGNPSFRALVDRVRETTLAAYEHQELPFERLVEDLQPSRDLAYPPLCQVMFAVQNEPVPLLRLNGVAPAELEYPGGTAKFDLTLFVRECADGWRAIAEYNVDLFDRATIRRLLAHFSAVVEAGLAAPDRPIGAIPMVSGAERRTLLVDWNRTAHDVDRTVCVHELFERQVRQRPDAVAVVHGARTLTYRELNAHANRIARRLRAAGIGHGARAGICLDASPLWVAAVFAVLKAGAAYVPLDPRYPRARLAEMAAGANLRALITRDPDADLGIADVPRLTVDLDHPPSPDEAADLDGVATPDSAFYVIFTSGSTGGPKGAAVTLRAFVNLVSWYIGEFGMTSGDRTLLSSSLSFDLTQKNVFAPLVAGGQLHLVEADVYDPRQIVDTIDRFGITIVNCTPSAFYPIVDRAADRSFAGLRSLRRVFLGGEPIVTAQLRPWIDSPACRAEVVNTYGPTECTDVVAAHRLTRDDWTSAAAVPIGRPIWNTGLVVLDGEGRLVPTGVPGELSVLGECVGPGYVNDAELTAERFVASGFPEQPGPRYRTGDTVRQRADGAIEFLGRLDHQVKVRGFRIETGEIERALESHPDVRECAVCALASPSRAGAGTAPAATRLVAFLAGEAGRAISVPDLRSVVAARLPDYMVPAAFVMLEALPLTPSGKVDRLALGRVNVPAQPMAADTAPPASDVERALSAIWCRVLDLDRVGLHDNFFDLGGHSLLMVRLQTEIARELDRDVSIVDLFRAPSVAALARLLAARTSRPDPVAAARARARRQRQALDLASGTEAR
jgi:amino acid adenylation domain-containing protein